MRLVFAGSIALLACLSFSTEASTATVVSEDEKSELVSQAEVFRKDTSKTEEPSPLHPTSVIHVTEPPTKTSEEEGPHFTLQVIEIEGVTVYKKGELDRLAEAYKNREISLKELRELAVKITDRYKSDDYVTSRALVPPQDIQDGRAVLQVLEGRLGRVKVLGNRWFSSRLYERLVQPKPGELLRYQDLMKSLFRINREPDRSVQGYLEAGEKPATSDLVLKAEETHPFHASYEFNNRGSKLTHRGRHLFKAVHNNFFGSGDTLNANVSLAEEGAIEAYSAGYSHSDPLTDLTYSMSLSYSETMLVKHLKSAEVKGESLTFMPALTKNFIDERHIVLDGSLGLDIKDSKTLIDDFKTDFDRSRAIRVGPRLTLSDLKGKTYVTGDAHVGIPHFLGSRDEGDFLYYTADLYRYHALSRAGMLILRAGGQWAEDDLLSIDQYRVGGATSVRGYPEADGFGDSGTIFSAESRLPLPFIAGNPAADSVRWSAFIDGGETDADFFLGAGVGLHIDAGRSRSLHLEWAYPLGDDSSDKNRPQLHVSCSIGW